MRKTRDFLRHFLFLRLYSGKENTHIPSQLLDSSFLDWDYIPEQEKVLDTVQLLDSSFLDWDYISEQGKVLDTVRLLDITTRVLLSTYTTQAYTHDA